MNEKKNENENVIVLLLFNWPHLSRARLLRFRMYFNSKRNVLLSYTCTYKYKRVHIMSYYYQNEE